MSKIVLIHPSAGVNWNGNSEIFALELARRLDNYFEVELLSGADCGSFSRPIKSITRSDVSSLTHHPIVASILYKWFSHPEIALEHLTSFLPCVAYLLKHPADLIFPQNDYGGLFVATCVRAIKGTPIMFTEQNSLLNEGKRLKRNLSLQPDRLIVLNPEVADYARNLAPNQLLNIIPHGVNTDEFTPVGKAISTGLPKPTILCVAPLNRDGNQRIELTIKAVSRLPQASLLICGNGADRDYFQALGDRLLGSDRFQIRVFAYAQMPQVYRSADVFTLPSLEEPRGLAYLEAMACGLPVVAPDDTVRRYLIGHGGITCDVEDLDAYTESLQIALEKHWHWQQQPRKNALRFSWQEIIMLYRQAVLQTITRSNSNLVPLTNC
ncbi:MAG: glycosyltransferase [Pleurocapsa sp. MO_192.B19]|nr:glycosyltransferase [Pleurocapsa sp. MO_192.B19]